MVSKLRNLTPANERYRLDEHRFIITSAGRRSRKTLIGKRKTLTRAMKKVGKYYHAAPTMTQAISIFWEDLKKYTAGITKRRSETHHFIELLNGSIIQVVGLDKAERIEGIPCDGIHITETPNLKPTAWREHIRPILSDTKGWAILDGVPEGRNFYYDLALNASNGSLPITQPIQGAYTYNKEWSYHNWFSSDVLDADEIKSVMEELDGRTFRQEYQGSFEGVEGLAYYNFSTENIDNSIKYIPGAVVYVGMDFNVDPMTAVFCHIDNKDNLLQFGEAYLKNSNTPEMAEHIADLFPIDDVEIHPDSTGSARDSTSTKTDLKILEDYGFEVFAKKSNPRVKDRVNAMNSRFKSMTGKVKYKVNAEKCPYTVKDFNRVERLPDGRLDPQQEKIGLKHITDGLGYLVYYKYPMISNQVRAIL